MACLHFIDQSSPRCVTLLNWTNGACCDGNESRQFSFCPSPHSRAPPWAQHFPIDRRCLSSGPLSASDCDSRGRGLPLPRPAGLCVGGLSGLPCGGSVMAYRSRSTSGAGGPAWTGEEHSGSPAVSLSEEQPLWASVGHRHIEYSKRWLLAEWPIAGRCLASYISGIYCMYGNILFPCHLHPWLGPFLTWLAIQKFKGIVMVF